MRVLVCGDRHWSDYTAIRNKLASLNVPDNHPITVIDGAARGADSMGHEAALQLGYATQRFPAQWDKYGKAAGPIRNQQMLDEGHPDLVLAFHKDIERSRGTKDMVARARKAGIKTEVTT